MRVKLGRINLGTERDEIAATFGAMAFIRERRQSAARFKSMRNKEQTVKLTKRFNWRIEWHMGIGEDCKGNPILPPEQAYIKREALRLIVNTYGGASLTVQSGAWQNEAGSLIEEDGITLVAYAESYDYDIALRAAIMLASLANQTAVIFARWGLDGNEVTVR